MPTLQQYLSNRLIVFLLAIILFVSVNVTSVNISSLSNLSYLQMLRMTQFAAFDWFVKNSNITDTLTIQSGADADINVIGSNVISDHSTLVTAGRNVSIETAESTRSSYNNQQEKESGLITGGGLSFTIGKQQQSTDKDNTEVSHTGSMVGSVKGGDTTIIARGKYKQQGSVVTSVNVDENGQPVLGGKKGDVNVLAKQIEVTSVTDTMTADTEQKFKQSGLTVSLSVPVVDAAMNAVNTAKTVGKSKNNRVNAMAVANAIRTAGQAGQAVQALANANNAKDLTSGVSLSVSLGSQKSQSEQHIRSEAIQGSTINADGKVNLVATGGDKSSITIIGSDVVGAKGTNLLADHDINLLAASGTSSENSSNKSSGGSIGLKISSNGEFGVNLSANKGKGYGKGNGTTYSNTHVGSLTDKTTINAGNKLSLIGAQAIGKGVSVSAKDLSIESLQDTQQYNSKQKNMGGSITVGAGVSGSASFKQSKINANHKAVAEQSGILTGDDGFQVNVTDHTELKGGMITSTAKAEAAGNNSFSTGTISTSDLQNHSDYKAKGIGLAGGVTLNGGWDGAAKDKQGNTIKRGVTHNPGYGKDSDKQSNVTISGIGTKNITVADVNSGDLVASLTTSKTTDEVLADTGLENRFDKAAVQSEIDLQVSVTQEFDVTRKVVRQAINEKITELDKKVKTGDATQAELDNLKMAGLIVDGIGGALYAPNANGILGDAAQIASPHIAKQIGDYFTGDKKGSAAHALVHTVLAAAVAAAGGNDALTAGLSAGGAELAAPVVSKWMFNTDNPDDLTVEQKQTISNITSLIGTGAGFATGNVTDIAASTNAAANAVDNNWLTHKENKLRDDNRKYLTANCSSRNGNPDSPSCKKAQENVDRLNAVDEIRDDKLYESRTACTRGEKKGCRAFVYAHVILRRILTEQTYEEFKADQQRLSEADFHAKWEVIPQDDYHQWDDHLAQNKEVVGNIKLQDGGQKEVVVHYGENSTSYKDYVIVTDHTNAATYNYGPSKFTNHQAPDVSTYIDFGSGPGDRTSYSDRNFGIAYYAQWGDLEDLSEKERNRAIATFNSVANECVVNGSNACAQAYENYSTNPTWGGLINRDDHRGMFTPDEGEKK